MVVFFVVKRYAVREAKQWRYAVRKAKIRRYAVRKGGGECHPHNEPATSLSAIIQGIASTIETNK